MKKRVYRRALRIAAQCFARAGYCVSAPEGNSRLCAAAARGEVVCERCIRDFFQRKAVEELRQEGRL